MNTFKQESNKHGLSEGTQKAVLAYTDFLVSSPEATSEDALRAVKRMNKDELLGGLIKHQDEFTIHMEKARTINLTLTCEEVLETFEKNDLISLAITVSDCVSNALKEANHIYQHARALHKV